MTLGKVQIKVVVLAGGQSQGVKVQSSIDRIVNASDIHGQLVVDEQPKIIVSAGPTGDTALRVMQSRTNRGHSTTSDAVGAPHFPISNLKFEI